MKEITIDNLKNQLTLLIDKKSSTLQHDSIDIDFFNLILENFKAEEISNIIFFIIDIKDNSCWDRETRWFTNELIKLLVILRDKEEIKLTIFTLIDFIVFEQCENLLNNQHLDSVDLSELRKYISHIPGDKSDILSHHHYVTMDLKSSFKKIIEK